MIEQFHAVLASRAVAASCWTIDVASLAEDSVLAVCSGEEVVVFVRIAVEERLSRDNARIGAGSENDEEVEQDGGGKVKQRQDRSESPVAGQDDDGVRDDHGCLADIDEYQSRSVLGWSCDTATAAEAVVARPGFVEPRHYIREVLYFCNQSYPIKKLPFRCPS